MTHGWPGSVVELLETVGPLTDPTGHGGSAEDAFHLVLPSLPGYGFSAEPVELGWDLGRTARAWAELMRRLGYTRYVAQGGDVGAGVTDAMGRQAPEGWSGPTRICSCRRSAARCRRTRTRNALRRRRSRLRSLRERLLRRDGDAAADDRLRPARLSRRIGRLDDRSRHGRLHKIASAFVDGQPSGNLTPRPRPRQHHAVLADRHRRLGCPVVLGGLRADAPAAGAEPLPATEIPFGFTSFPGEIWRTPRSWVEASYPNVTYFNEVDKGGHFAAWEEPELFATEIRAAFKSLRNGEESS